MSDPLDALAARETRDAPGLYVHVPYCEAKCSYCDFYSVARGDVTSHRFVDALAREAEHRVPHDFAPATVFIGGGTPTALDMPDFDAMLALVLSHVKRSGRLHEWTVECNPNSLSAEKARAMLDAGVTRFSIGVQSFDADVLRSVGRVHTPHEARRAVEIARAAGATDVSVDLLFAIPGQGVDTFRRDLDEAVRLGTDHVSAYALIYEPGTALTAKRDAGLVTPEDDEKELSMMRIAEDRLGEAGLLRYEVSNFARPGHTCRHNQATWRNGEYIGLGPSAVTHTDRTRRRNVADWRTWQSRALATGEATGEVDGPLTPVHALAEELMLRLRTREGAPLALLERRHGIDVKHAFDAHLSRFADAGLLTVQESETGPWVAFTARGFELADGMLAELLDAATSDPTNAAPTSTDQTSAAQTSAAAPR